MKSLLFFLACLVLSPAFGQGHIENHSKRCIIAIPHLSGYEVNRLELNKNYTAEDFYGSRGSSFDNEKPTIVTISGDLYQLETQRFLLFPKDTVRIDTAQDGKNIIHAKYGKEVELLNALAALEVISKKDSISGKLQLRLNPVVFDEARISKMKTRIDSAEKVGLIRPAAARIFEDRLAMLKRLEIINTDIFNTRVYSVAEQKRLKQDFGLRKIDSLAIFMNQFSTKDVQLNGDLLYNFIEDFPDILIAVFEDKNQVESYLKSHFSPILLEPLLANFIIKIDQTNDLKAETLFNFFDIAESDDILNSVHRRISYGNLIKNDSTILATPMLDLEEKTTTWREVLKINESRLLYFYIVKENCPICKEGVQKVKAMQKKHPEVLVYFLSIDPTEAIWLRTIAAYGLAGSGKQLRIEPQSLLARLLAEPDLPRGVLFNADGFLESLYMNDPTSPDFEAACKQVAAK